MYVAILKGEYISIGSAFLWISSCHNESWYIGDGILCWAGLVSSNLQSHSRRYSLQSVRMPGDAFLLHSSAPSPVHLHRVSSPITTTSMPEIDDANAEQYRCNWSKIHEHRFKPQGSNKPLEGWKTSKPFCVQRTWHGRTVVRPATCKNILRNSISSCKLVCCLFFLFRKK